MTYLLVQLVELWNLKLFSEMLLGRVSFRSKVLDMWLLPRGSIRILIWWIFLIDRRSMIYEEHNWQSMLRSNLHWIQWSRKSAATYNRIIWGWVHILRMLISLRTFSAISICLIFPLFKIFTATFWPVMMWWATVRMKVREDSRKATVS